MPNVDLSSNLALPFLAPAQSQKHVTHNEALSLLDLLVQLVVQDFAVETPPVAPEEGAVWALGAAPQGDWAGQAGHLAAWQNGGWVFVPPRAGWRATGLADGSLRIWSGSAWTRMEMDNLDGIGIGTAHDSTNRLAVAAAATLLTHAGADHRLVLNKASSPDTGALLFQTGWSGRAEMGLTGSDDFTLKVSADGSAWHDGLVLERHSGKATLPAGAVIEAPVTGSAVVQSATDATAGRLLSTGYMGLGATSAPLLADIDSFTIPQGFYSVSNASTAGTLPPASTSADHVIILRPAANQTTQIYSIPNTPGTFIRTSSASAAWGPWRRVYDQRTVLGTVSQSGGHPTGALFQRGSNTNGEFLRFADGTQFCWHLVTTSASGEVTWTYPAAFSTTSGLRSVVGVNSATVGLIAGRITARTVNSLDVSILTTTGRVAAAAEVLSIGRWF